MALKILCLLPILLLSLTDIRCQDNGDLLNNLLREANNFEDLDTDFELSRTKLLLKNKRDEYGGREGYSSFNSIGDSSVVDDPESWTGRWLPEKVIPKHRVVSKRLNDTDHQSHDIKLMTSTINANCDDGKTNLTVDWSGSPVNHTCFRRTFIEPDVNAAAFIIHDYIPKAYHARHLCMNDKIEYSSYLPTFGPHRPAWARYGEYEFLPVQRWLHNLEHGAIIMLYHPCAHPLLVNKLRNIVTSCLYRHIITPYTLLGDERPLAIVSWGWAMTMSDVDQHLIEQFIKEHALHGSEMLSKDGDYDHLLKKPAEIITNVDDEIICPNSIQQHM